MSLTAIAQFRMRFISSVLNECAKCGHSPICYPSTGPLPPGRQRHLSHCAHQLFQPCKTSSDQLIVITGWICKSWIFAEIESIFIQIERQFGLSGWMNSKVLIGVAFHFFLMALLWNDNEIEGKPERRYRVFAWRIYFKRRVTACWWSIIIYLCCAIHVVIIARLRFIELPFGVLFIAAFTTGIRHLRSNRVNLTGL